MIGLNICRRLEFLLQRGGSPTESMILQARSLQTEFILKQENEKSTFDILKRF